MHWRFSLLVVLTVLLLAVPAGALAGLGRGQTQQGLLEPAASPGSIDRGGEPAVVRERFVDVGLLLSALRADPQRLNLNLFADVSVSSVGQVVDRGPDGSLTWQGVVEGRTLSAAVLVVRDGLLVGNVSWPGAFYQVRYAGSGVHAVYEIDQAAFPLEAEPLAAAPPAAGPAAAAQAAAEAAPAGPADSGSIVDLLVTYTPDARTAAGGAAAILAEIELAVAETNMSYANSQVAQRLHLVHAAELPYFESGNLNTDLERLQITGDGFLDDVHALRDAYAADEVALLVANGGGLCGIAYQLDDPAAAWFEAWAFATVDRDCATGYYSFGHELGHNMGANHDWFRNSSLTPFTYSHGFYNVAGAWRTMMAYPDGCQAASVNCTRVPYWSNPAVYYGGAPMGIAGGTSTSCLPYQPNPGCDADNHRTLNDTAYLVANFRTSIAGAPSAPGWLTATAISPSQIDLTWVDLSDDELGFAVERSVTFMNNFTEIARVGPRVTSYTDLGLSPGTTYIYQVRAYNLYGNSPYSNPASDKTLVLGPLSPYRRLVVDDNSGGTTGDGDGRVDCGETVDLWLAVRNEGTYGADNVSVAISSSDPYLSILANTQSTYGQVAAGAVATNVDDFDLRVATGAPHGHAIPLTLNITAANGGPWQTRADLLVTCGGPLYSYALPWTIKQHFAFGFDSWFTGGASGWQAHSGTWWIDNNSWYTSDGLVGAWASAGRTESFADLYYFADLWREGCTDCAHGLLVRGNPTPLGAGNRWNTGYGFYVRRSGQYSVFRYDNGTSTALQNWTTSTAVADGAWNNLGVVARGDSFTFIVNGVTVWSGSDATYPAGRVGLTFYRNASSAGDQLWVDRAMLTAPPSWLPLAGTSAAQQKLNAAATGPASDTGIDRP